MVSVGGSFKSRPQSHTERVLRLDLYPGPKGRSHAHRQDDRSVSPRDSAPVMPELVARQKMEARNNEDGLRLRNSAPPPETSVGYPRRSPRLNVRPPRR